MLRPGRSGRRLIFTARAHDARQDRRRETARLPGAQARLCNGRNGLLGRSRCHGAERLRLPSGGHRGPSSWCCSQHLIDQLLVPPRVLFVCIFALRRTTLCWRQSSAQKVPSVASKFLTGNTPDTPVDHHGD
jgi:hypothetical protein